ncbi:MAG: P1 family peptidase, partial [Woeseiaceae bacterium]
KGAGRGATAGTVAGGIGSTSIDLGGDAIVGALAVVNSIGSVLLPDGESFYAWPYEQANEFGNRPSPAKCDLGDPFPEFSRLHEADRIQAGTNTTLAAVATTVALTGAELKRIAMMAHDGMARAIRPAHTPFDGDIVFALSNGDVTLPEKGGYDRASSVAKIGSAAADCLARAIARGVYESGDPSNRKTTL